MLIGCITGPDLETAKDQVNIAEQYCDGLELREDLLKCCLDFPKMPLVITTNHKGSTLSDGRTMSVYHNFRKTPEDLDAVLQKMPRADLYKIATMANSITDALRMLVFCKDKPHVIGVCMGEYGQMTRILGPIVNNACTFAAVGKEAAPGQLQAKDLVEMYHYHRLTPSTSIYGLIGNPISQSPSHQTHNTFFRENDLDAVYVKMALCEDELPEFFRLIRELPFKGLSVTIPFKEKVLKYIEHFEGEAKEIGAVNTIAIEDKIYGANTDGLGALNAIEEKGSIRGKHCVILGAGGAAKAIGYEAIKRGATVSFHSRRYGNFKEISTYDVLINTTPISSPIDLEKIIPRTVVMDVNHGHEHSPLMIRAKALGCKLIFGKTMFEQQALGQFNRWFPTLLCCS